MIPAAVAMSLLLNIMVMCPSIYTSNKEPQNRHGSVSFFYDRPNPRATETCYEVASEITCGDCPYRKSHLMKEINNLAEVT